ncbi:MAG: hypothetical protein CUN55_12960 [Phototrophicales bacterium]|nr:MAG: hypothetical protein CUN55_12960 [Phototrophicales bacterium]
MFGLGAIGLTQVAVWSVVGGGMAYIQTDISDFIAASGVGIFELVRFIGLYILAYLMFSGLAISVGAIFSAEQEARQFAVIFNLLAILPIGFISVFFSSDNVFAYLFLLFPITSPLAILMVLSFGTISIAWVYVSILILIISLLVIMWGGARIFRAGMLMYGQRLTVKQVWRALRLGGT